MGNAEFYLVLSENTTCFPEISEFIYYLIEHPAKYYAETFHIPTPTDFIRNFPTHVATITQILLLAKRHSEIFHRSPNCWSNIRYLFHIACEFSTRVFISDHQSRDICICMPARG